MYGLLPFLLHLTDAFVVKCPLAVHCTVCMFLNINQCSERSKGDRTVCSTTERTQGCRVHHRIQSGNMAKCILGCRVHHGIQSGNMATCIQGCRMHHRIQSGNMATCLQGCRLHHRIQSENMATCIQGCRVHHRIQSGKMATCSQGGRLHSHRREEMHAYSPGAWLLIMEEPCCLHSEYIDTVRKHACIQ